MIQHFDYWFIHPIQSCFGKPSNINFIAILTEYSLAVIVIHAKYQWVPFLYIFVSKIDLSLIRWLCLLTSKKKPPKCGEIDLKLYTRVLNTERAYIWRLRISTLSIINIFKTFHWLKTMRVISCERSSPLCGAAASPLKSDFMSLWSNLFV